MENKIDILNLSGYYLKNKEKYEFILYDISAKVEVDKIYNNEIIIPSEEKIFMKLFNEDIFINNIKGINRDKSLIESLFYKFNNAKIIENIEYLPNKFPEFYGKNKKEMKALDYSFLCKLKDGSKYIINLAIQNFYYEGLDLNALGYAKLLRN